MKSPKVLFWDLETTNLKANAGYLLCAGYKWQGKKKVYVPSIKQHPGSSIVDDGPLVQHFAETLAKADMWVTYNGKRFDVTWMNTRLLKHRLPPLPPIPHVDVYLDIVRPKLSMTSKRLVTVQQFLELEDEKSPVDLSIWIQAMAGDRKALKYIITHCRQDVLVLEETYDRLAPLTTQKHPRLYGYGPCMSCGSERLTSQGYRPTAQKTWKRQLQCKDCGKWETRTMTKGEYKEFLKTHPNVVPPLSMR